jgi:hypothetical protein
MLRRGIQIPGKALTDLFRGRSKAFHAGIVAARIDGAAVRPGLIFERDWAGKELLLQVGSSP